MPGRFQTENVSTAFADNEQMQGRLQRAEVGCGTTRAVFAFFGGVFVTSPVTASACPHKVGGPPPPPHTPGWAAHGPAAERGSDPAPLQVGRTHTLSLTHAHAHKNVCTHTDTCACTCTPSVCRPSYGRRRRCWRRRCRRTRRSWRCGAQVGQCVGGRRVSQLCGPPTHCAAPSGRKQAHPNIITNQVKRTCDEPKSRPIVTTPQRRPRWPRRRASGSSGRC
jgi:hypothetical protein